MPRRHHMIPAWPVIPPAGGGGGGGGGLFAPDFPRLGRYDIGGWSYSNTTLRDYWKKQHIIIHNGWDGGEGLYGTMTSWQSAVKAGSTVGSQKILFYTDTHLVDTTGTGMQKFRDQANTSNWLVRQSYPSGTVSFSYWDTSHYLQNFFSGGNTAGGYEGYQWWARWKKDFIYDGGAGGFAFSQTANANQDGQFWDDLLVELIGNNANGTYPTDYQRTGTAQNNATGGFLAAFRSGQVSLVQYMQSILPDKFHIANFSQGYNSTNRTNMTGAFSGVFNGGVAEHCLGGTTGLTVGNTNEQNGDQLTVYQWAQDLATADKSILVNHNGLTSTGKDGIDATNNYRAMRYGLCFTLVHGDGYYSPNTGSYDGLNNTSLIFDEFTGGAIGSAGYMGQAVDARQTSPYSNGVYVRKFYNSSAGRDCLAVVNPPGNGTQTITLPAKPHGGNWTFLTGTQDSTTNSGASTGGSLTIAARDGRILI